MLLVTRCSNTGFLTSWPVVLLAWGGGVAGVGTLGGVGEVCCGTGAGSRGPGEMTMYRTGSSTHTTATVIHTRRYRRFCDTVRGASGPLGLDMRDPRDGAGGRSPCWAVSVGAARGET